VLDEAGQRLDPHAPCPHGRRLHYWRWHAQEPALPWRETIVFQDEWLVVADKPHFMPSRPAAALRARACWPGCASAWACRG
jgi:tRNA pseudouridine32 synthase/23S rRNA pseudouridine746 synthase